MMQLPNTLEGMLQDIHGQVAVAPAKEEAASVIPTPTPPQKRKQAKVIPASGESPIFVSGDDLWTAFCAQCVSEDQLPKTVGKEGATSFCKVDKDILATFRRYSVGGYSTQTMVNAILRSFILHYKKQFNEYRIKERPLL
jgi:hypothetical protein